ncbi:MAG: PEP-CTERM sorting domain-containing protein [Nitrospirae bacterium]|nr:PEP-CTERM sorting domain-containing protein [Nitrospirota bacterium]
MKKIIMILILSTVVCLAVSIEASTMFLEDWGVTPENWTPATAPSNIEWATEDFTGEDGGFVSPGWGGQPFDSEAAYMAFDDSKLYIAIITGMPQSGSEDPWRYDNDFYDNTFDWNRGLEKYWYDPGDIGIDIDGNGSYEFAVTTRVNNSKSSYAPTPGDGMLLSGNLEWVDPRAWKHYFLYNDWGGVSDPWAVTGYDAAMDMGDSFSYSAFGDSHYAIEMVIDTSLLGLESGDLLSMHWVMECGNDNINLTSEVPSSVPEPSTLILLSLGIAGLFIYTFIRPQAVKVRKSAGRSGVEDRSRG